jgi:hypothetical protein
MNWWAEQLREQGGKSTKFVIHKRALQALSANR